MAINVIPVVMQDAQKRDLMKMLTDCFAKSVTSRLSQIDGEYQKWLDNYNAKPATKVRTTPFPNASNFVPQLIRMHTDILTARLIGIIYGTRPFWKPTTFLKECPNDWMMALASWMQWICFNKINMYPTVDSIIAGGFKYGTVVTKQFWQENKLNKLSGNQGGVPTFEEVSDANLCIDVVPFEDFYPYPVTAKRIEFCSIKFHRLRFTEDEILYKKAIALWNPDATDLLIKTGKDSMGGSKAQQQEAQRTNIQLIPDIGRPFNVIEAHLNYQLTPGKLVPMIVTFNPQINTEKGILRAIYKPNADPFAECFTDFRPFPKDNSFYGDCIPAILEQSQEEQAQIHNARRDANTIANVPGWKKKKYADVASPSDEWYPGKVWQLEDMQDLEPLQFSGNYNSMVDEESFLMQTVERYTGVSPAMQGAGAGVNGKRGNYASQGTLALISEGNRRIDVYLRRNRMPFNNIGKQIFCGYRDFGDPSKDWSPYGEYGQTIQTIFQNDGKLSGGNTFFELSASDAGANRETDRSALMLMAQTMAGYYQQIVQLAQAVAGQGAQSPFGQLMLQVADGARDLANRILFVFDIGDRDKLVPDLRKVLGGEQPNPENGQPGPGSSLGGGLPEPSADVSQSGVQDLSAQLTQLTGGLNSQVPQ